MLNNEPLVEGQLIEVKWKNRTVSKHHIELEGSMVNNSCHNDNWTVIHYRPFIEVDHNDTKILVSAFGLKARRVEPK